MGNNRRARQSQQVATNTKAFSKFHFKRQKLDGLFKLIAPDEQIVFFSKPSYPQWNPTSDVSDYGKNERQMFLFKVKLQ